MALLSRVIQRIFGETGGVDEFGEIGSRAAGTPQTTKNLTDIQSRAQYLLGWFSTTIRQTLPSMEQADLPASEDINSLFFLITSQLAYLFQNGIPEWLNSVDQRYYENVSFVQLDGAIYQARLGNDTTEINSQQMPSENSIWWRLLWAPTTSAFYRTVSSATTIDLAVQTPPKAIELTGTTAFTLTVNNAVQPPGSILMIQNTGTQQVTLAGTSGLSGFIAVNQVLIAVSTNGSMVQLSNQTTNRFDTPTFDAISTGQGANELYPMDQAVRTTDDVTFATVNTGQGANELYPMNQGVRTTDTVSFNDVNVATDVSAATATISGALQCATIDTGQGPVEAYAMNQPVQTTDTVTFGSATITGGLTSANINTGQGATEIFRMDQAVRTTDNVTFAAVTTGAMDTGQGLNELYAMNQNVRTSDTVTFSSMRQTTFGSRTQTQQVLTISEAYVIPTGKYILSISTPAGNTATLQVRNSTEVWVDMDDIEQSQRHAFHIESDGINLRVLTGPGGGATIVLLISIF